LIPDVLAEEMMEPRIRWKTIYFFPGGESWNMNLKRIWLITVIFSFFLFFDRDAFTWCLAFLLTEFSSPLRGEGLRHWADSV
jgi:hypothetical protein